MSVLKYGFKFNENQTLSIVIFIDIRLKIFYSFEVVLTHYYDLMSIIYVK